MNVVITLPKNLINSILSGAKRFEMRKNFPVSLHVGVEGFFVVEKGTNQIRCWCRVSYIHKLILTSQMAVDYAPYLGVSPDYILNYQSLGEYVFLWAIDYVRPIFDTHLSALGVSKNPQNYSYCLKTYDFAGNDRSANVAHVENLNK